MDIELTNDEKHYLKTLKNLPLPLFEIECMTVAGERLDSMDRGYLEEEKKFLQRKAELVLIEYNKRKDIL